MPTCSHCVGQILLYDSVMSSNLVSVHNISDLSTVSTVNRLLTVWCLKSSYAVETNNFLVENNVPTTCIGKKNPQLMCNKHYPSWVGKLSPIVFAVGILTSVG